MAVRNEWFFPRGELHRDGWESVVDESIPGWKHTGIRVAELAAGESLELPAGDVERIVVPLSGSFEISHGESMTRLLGRPGVFDGPTDVLYIGAGEATEIRGAGRFAVAEAPTAVSLPSRYVAAADVPIELRGSGRDSRQVHNFGTPAVLDAVGLIVCEVITPAGNWSSHPAHKHDEYRDGHESQLEEIYYFEAAPTRTVEAPSDSEAFGSFATYSSPVGDIDTNATVRTGDIALVPYGYHGPAAAAPEYDLYYLNVMAGPDPARVWLVSDDPAQAWIRTSWETQATDPRLPYPSTSKGASG